VTPDLSYPIGRFQRPAAVSDAAFVAAIDAIRELPVAFRQTVGRWTGDRLTTPYRPGGWTATQVVHHVADSHMQAYGRCKMALTAETPVITPYDEARWATLADTAGTPVEVSLVLLDALHRRWSTLLASLTGDARARTVRHPESGIWRVDEMALLYQWHGAHHLAHLTGLAERSGWH